MSGTSMLPLAGGLMARQDASVSGFIGFIAVLACEPPVDRLWTEIDRINAGDVS
jgi:hypothetical protein